MADVETCEVLIEFRKTRVEWLGDAERPIFFHTHLIDMCQGIVIAISSCRAVAASAKSTPCFWGFDRAFAGSHSTSTRVSVCTGVHHVRLASPRRRRDMDA